MFPKTATVRLTVDDTLARHTGKHIEAAAMHHDPLLSSANKPFFHFGHQWVVLAVVVPFARWGKVFSLPVLVRLYRPEKLNRKLDRPHRKKTELADEMLQLVAESFPDRKFRVCPTWSTVMVAPCGNFSKSRGGNVISSAARNLPERFLVAFGSSK